MAHSAVWGPPPFKDKTQIQKKLTIEKLSEGSLRKCTKFGQDHSNTFVDSAFHVRSPDLAWVTSSVENIHLTRKKKIRT